MNIGMIGLGIQVLMDVILRHKPELIAGDKFITEKFKKKYMQQYVFNLICS
jgi:hypothetical protein